MASKQAKVRCPHCSVEFGFALPQKYVERPNKNLKFICEYCTERFSVLVSELFSEDGTELASLKIRHQSINGLQLYSSWEDALQSHFDTPIEDSDPISAFGKEWKPASMFEELSAIFPHIDIEPAAEEQIDKEEEVEEDIFVEVEEEPSYEDDLFMDKPLKESNWEEKVEAEIEDPFDIPVSNISDDIEDDALVDLIADGAMDSFLEESEEPPVDSVEEESEDPFLAISDEIEIQQDHSIDALISTLDTELEKTESTGTNTLDLLQSEDVESSQGDLPPEVEPEWEDSEDVVLEADEEPVNHTEEELETMRTVIDSSPYESLGLSEDTIQSSGFQDDEEFVLATATVVSEEDSHEESEDQTQTLISTPSWVEEEEESVNEAENPAEDLSFFTPDSWDEEEVEESNNASESIDYDQTEEEESQSALNPAFQINTKKVVRKQYWAVASAGSLALIAAVLIVRYSSLSDVRGFFMPIDEVEVQKTPAKNKTVKKQDLPKKTVTQAVTKTETKVTKEPIESLKVEPVQQDLSKKEPVQKNNDDQKEMLTVAPKKDSFINDKPLSKNKKEKKVQRKTLPKLPPMDPKRATREGWIKLEDKSYESAKAIFEDVIKNEPTPKAFLGLGFAEERMAERYKDRKDFIRVEAHYDQAHKYYCEAMEYYEREDVVNDKLRFDIKYLQARLKVISRACI